VDCRSVHPETTPCRNGRIKCLEPLDGALRGAPAGSLRVGPWLVEPEKEDEFWSGSYCWSLSDADRGIRIYVEGWGEQDEATVIALAKRITGFLNDPGPEA
jgi:hypothetical protein